MRILLVYTNRYRVMAAPPVGLAYLVGPLRGEGHEVKLLDLMFSKSPRDELGATIDSFRPDIVGFSVRNVDNQDMRHTAYFIGQAKELVDVARSRGVTIVLGGTAFTTFPAEMLSYMGADYGIAGQGEKSLPLLARSLEAGHVDKTIAGLAWRENGAIRLNPPDFHGYGGSRAEWGALDLDGYMKGLFAGAVVTKTGCPHRCAYCNVTSSFGGRFAFRSADDVVGEIRELRRAYGVKMFSLTDACFNTPMDYAKDLLRAIARARLHVYLHSTLVPVRGQFDDEFFALYKKAGGILLSLGTETLSEKMLRSYHKPFTLDDILACARLCDRHRMPFVVQALFGGPGEDASTVKESMGMLPEIHYSRLVYSIGIRLLPGTALFDMAKKEGLVKDASELFRPTFYVSKGLDVDWADRYIRRSLRRYAYRNLKMLPVIARCTLARARAVNAAMLNRLNSIHGKAAFAGDFKSGK